MLTNKDQVDAAIATFVDGKKATARLPIRHAGRTDGSATLTVVIDIEARAKPQEVVDTSEPDTPIAFPFGNSDEPAA